MNSYDAAFHANRDAETRYDAETILTIVQEAIPDVHAAIDVGCGVGTWLSVLRARGVEDVLGIDGDWVDPNALVIPAERFRRHDLNSALPVGKKYDLVISLEVAEHLPAARAESFVTDLTELSDFVLFSAAIPGQGGTNHVNEQLADYWIRLFDGRAYAALDIIRRRIWDDERIAVHYRQNTLLFVKRDRATEVRVSTGDASGPLSIIHPRLYLNKMEHWTNPTISQSLKFLATALVKRIERIV
jgi:SAM-dependent methyltransferase